MKSSSSEKLKHSSLVMYIWSVVKWGQWMLLMSVCNVVNTLRVLLCDTVMFTQMTLFSIFIFSFIFSINVSIFGGLFTAKKVEFHIRMLLARVTMWAEVYAGLLSLPPFLARLCNPSLILNYWVRPFQGRRVHSVHSTAFTVIGHYSTALPTGTMNTMAN